MVTVLDDLSTSSLGNLFSCSRGGGVSFVRGDVRDGEAGKKIVQILRGKFN